MIRLFKHYIPHAVLLLGLLDFALLVLASETAWQLRAGQIGMDLEGFGTRWVPLLGTSLVIWLAMIAVGVYGPYALRSLRFAGARVLVAISLGIIALAVMRGGCDGFGTPAGRAQWRNLGQSRLVAPAWSGRCSDDASRLSDALAELRSVSLIER